MNALGPRPAAPSRKIPARADGESTAAALLFVAAVIVSVLLGAMILALCSGCGGSVDVEGTPDACDSDPRCMHPFRLCADKDAGDPCGAEGNVCTDEGACGPAATEDAGTDAPPASECVGKAPGAPCGDGGTCDVVFPICKGGAA